MAAKAVADRLEDAVGLNGAEETPVDVSLADLCNACRNGNLQAVQALLDVSGASLASQPYQQGQTCLFYATLSGDVQLIDWLLSNTAVDVNGTDNLNQTALFVAAAKGHLASVQSLLQRGANPNHEDSQGQTPLSYACGRGRISAARAIAGQPGVSVDHRDRHGTTPLQMAAAKGQLEVVRWLVQDCAAKVDTSLPLSMDSPLHAAAKHGHLDCVIWLVEKAGARIEPRVPEGDWPAGNNVLAQAAGAGHIDTVRWLFTHCKFRDDSLEVALCKACSRGHLPVVRLLAGKGVSVNAVSHGKSVGLFACSLDRPAILQELIGHGLDLDTLQPHSALHEVTISRPCIRASHITASSSVSTGEQP